LFQAFQDKNPTYKAKAMEGGHAPARHLPARAMQWQAGRSRSGECRAGLTGGREGCQGQEGTSLQR